MNSLRYLRLQVRPAEKTPDASEYEVVLINVGARPARLRLTAHDEAQALTFALPAEVTVGPGYEERVRLTVTPRRRRWLGGPRPLSFEVAAAPTDDSRVEPVRASAVFEDEPKRLPVERIATALGAVAVIGLLAALVFVLGDDDNGSADNGSVPTAKETGFGSFTLTGSVRLTGDTRVSPPILCYHLEPENVPFRVRISVSVNGGGQVPLGEWDDNGVGGGDCVFVSLNPLPNERNAVTLEAFVNGVRVSQTSLGIITN